MPTIVDRQRAYLNSLAQGAADGSVLWPAWTTIAPGVARPKLDSHLLALAALPYARGRILDTFAGSGIVGLTLRPRADLLHFIDVNPNAVSAIRARCAADNLTVVAEVGDVFPRDPHRFDTIVANPPYTDAVPTRLVDRVCFDAGNASTRRFIALLAERLAPKGNAFLSWADYTAQSVEVWCAEAGLRCEICAELGEPSKVDSQEMIRYRVYRLQAKD